MTVSIAVYKKKKIVKDTPIVASCPSVLRVTGLTAR